MTVNAFDRLIDDGGFTLDLHTQDLVSEGFAVSVNPELTRVIKEPIRLTALLLYMADHFHELLDEGKTFGAWLDTETGFTHLDVVTVLSDREEAERLGRKHQEIAIFDIGTGTEIRL